MAKALAAMHFPTKLLRLAAIVSLVLTSATVTQAETEETDAFDRDAAAKALNAVSVLRCKKPRGPTGGGHVIVTFSPEGRAEDVVVDQPPFVGTSVGRCI